MAAVYTDRLLVWSEGEEWVCSLRGRHRREGLPVVGDKVGFSLNEDGTGALDAVRPRTSSLTRRAADRGRSRKTGGTQVLAANVDQLVIVAALWDPPFRAGLVERFLVAGAVEGLAPLLCITKTDLGAPEELAEWADFYRALAIPVVATSTLDAASLEQLAAALAGRTSVLVGHSGVGKTSLLNELSDAEMAVGDIGMGSVGRGRHTTTTARLIPLRGGGFAIDSAGVREFGLSGIAPADLAQHYPDVRPFLGQCGFGDCLHDLEPGCAVRAAAEAGELHAQRYVSYLTLLEEVRAEWDTKRN